MCLNIHSIHLHALFRAIFAPNSVNVARGTSLIRDKLQKIRKQGGGETDVYNGIQRSRDHADV